MGLATCFKHLLTNTIMRTTHKRLPARNRYSTCTNKRTISTKRCKDNVKNTRNIGRAHLWGSSKMLLAKKRKMAL